MTIKQLDPEAYARHQKELADSIYIEDQHFIFIIGDENTSPYDVAIDQCKTAEQVLSWAYHLSAKSWMTKEKLRYFIKIASKHNGIELT